MEGFFFFFQSFAIITCLIVLLNFERIPKPKVKQTARKSLYEQSLFGHQFDKQKEVSIQSSSSSNCTEVQSNKRLAKLATSAKQNEEINSQSDTESVGAGEKPVPRPKKKGGKHKPGSRRGKGGIPKMLDTIKELKLENERLKEENKQIPTLKEEISKLQGNISFSPKTSVEFVAQEF